MRNFQEAILSTGGMTTDAAVLMMYGEYLKNGGKREDFMDLSMEDIQIMYSVYMTDELRAMKRMTEAIAAIAGKELQEVY